MTRELNVPPALKASNSTLKRFPETTSVVSEARSGRLKVTTPSADQYIRLGSHEKSYFITDFSK